ncbi:hypothetical protein JTB14_028173 [Gonioctena quinquepunctata]|nr:hypothetical protein JTB14_028173 [Gonioctena quinquepunctata]
MLSCYLYFGCFLCSFVLFIRIQDVYMKARNKAKEAEQTSHPASEKEIKNRRKRIQKVLSSSGSSDEFILPSPPKPYMVNKENITVRNIAFDAISHLPNQNNAFSIYNSIILNILASKLKVIIEQNHLIRSISTDILSVIKEKGERYL